MSTDPLTFVQDALDLLPADPADSTVRDLLRLAAAAEGLRRIVQEVSENIGALDGRLRAGARNATVTRERTIVEARQRRGELARDRLKTYADATRARHHTKE